MLMREYSLDIVQRIFKHHILSISSKGYTGQLVESPQMPTLDIIDT